MGSLAAGPGPVGLWAYRESDSEVELSTYYQDKGPRLAWDTDVAKARSAWQEAKPVIEQLDRLMAWCQESEENLVILAEFLMTGKNLGVTLSSPQRRPQDT